MSSGVSALSTTANRGGNLALCWLVYGVVRIAAGIWLLTFINTATVMFGALLVRVPNPYSLMGVFHLVYAGLTFLAVASGIFGVLAGVALLAGQASGRVLALVASFLSVADPPVGTTLGIYTLIVFLR